MIVPKYIASTNNSRRDDLKLCACGQIKEFCSQIVCFNSIETIIFALKMRVKLFFQSTSVFFYTDNFSERVPSGLYSATR